MVGCPSCGSAPHFDPLNKGNIRGLGPRSAPLTRADPHCGAPCGDTKARPSPTQLDNHWPMYDYCSAYALNDVGSCHCPSRGIAQCVRRRGNDQEQWRCLRPKQAGGPRGRCDWYWWRDRGQSPAACLAGQSARDSAKAAANRSTPPGIEWLQGDALDCGSVMAAARGAELIVRAVIPPVPELGWCRPADDR